MITLQEQITTLEKAIGELKELQWNVDNYEAFLASLKELQEIKGQEPVAYMHRLTKSTELSFFNETSDGNWIGSIPLYASPVAIPEGMTLVSIEPTDDELVAGMEVLLQCQQMFLPTITTIEEVRTAMLKASKENK